MSKPLTRTNRIVAAALALMWICGGTMALLVFAMHGHRLLAMVPLLAIAYGGVWIRVAVTGRLLRWGRAR